ncbi:acyl carrier protein [Actinoplanes sp. NPDC049548]|uniref:acyl carrier protein n=1 Tax=Actinoplanes sp. NPDC049548 TaxID=3155152 RepID=UPI00343D43B5
MSTHKLKKVFVETLGLGAQVDWNGLRYRRVEQWDSVAHMYLVGEIEQVFDVMLETQDVLAMDSFAAATNILARHGVNFD